MSKFLIIAMFALLATGSGDKVYICNGPKSEKYHKTKECQGLKKCSTRIDAVDITFAKSKKRTECGYCYKR